MRAQTTLDFAVGISVFLLTTVFVFAFVPGLLQPFNEGAQEETVVADRLASQLSESMLVAADEPYVLVTECTNKFFEQTPTGSACGFNQSTDLSDPNGLTDRVGLAERQRLNITIREPSGDEELLCWNGAAVQPVSAGGCAITYAAGDAPPGGSSSVVSAARTVGIEGDDVRLTVRMW